MLCALMLLRVVSLVLLALAPLHARAATSPLYQWTQYVPGGLEARAIMDGDQPCPALVVDGSSATMAVRSSPGEKYPIAVCAARIVAGAKAASIAGEALPLPKPLAKKVLMIGDTGCRIAVEQVQNCLDESAWPFAKGAAIESTLAPDVVVHVGDFHYREAACPLGNAGCAGSPFGDSWAVWKADFFEPAKPLLAKAPWVFVRGNHEECSRGGKGWSRTLDPLSLIHI